MEAASRERRTPRRSISLIATGLVLVALVAIVAPAAGAAAKKTCWVKNTTLAKSYGPATGSVLQGAIDAAKPGNNLEVRGLCVGNFTINKNLTLVGFAKDNYPVATLDANHSGTVLFNTRPSGAPTTVSLTNLRITGGASNATGGGIVNDIANTLTLIDCEVDHNSAASGFGGGIDNINFAKLYLQGTTVHHNTAEFGGGIENRPNGALTDLSDGSAVRYNTATFDGGGFDNFGVVSVHDTSSVDHNAAQGSGGGINNEGTLTLNDSSSVSGNTATGDGGGVYNARHSTLTMNDSSSVSGNRADSDGDGSGTGGGISRCNDDSVTGAVDGGNVNDNFRGTGTTEDNISFCT